MARRKIGAYRKVPQTLGSSTSTPTASSSAPATSHQEPETEPEPEPQDIQMKSAVSLPISTIFPIQLLDKSPRSSDSDRFVHVQLPELDFEELAFRLDLGRFSSLSDPNQDEDEDRGFEIIEDSTISSKAKGKRKAIDQSNDQPSKRIKTEEDMFLARTKLLFSLEPNEDVDELTNLFDKPFNSVKLRCSPSKREEESFITNIVTLVDGNENLLVDLPIFQSSRIEPHRCPESYTNSEWLPSAIPLQLQGYLHIKSAVTLHQDNPYPPPEEFQSHNKIYLELQLELSLTPLSFTTPTFDLADHWLQVMRFCSPGPEGKEQQRRSKVDASVIYSNLVPAEMEGTDDCLQPESLRPTLFPFQRKAVEFMAGREGRFIDEGNSGLVQTVRGPSEIGLFYEKVSEDLYFNSLNSFFTRDASQVKASNLKGGIFSEEMGLGKSVEVICIILLNQSPSRSSLPAYFSKDLSTEVQPVSATLIVAPETLRQQWLDEADLHSDLRVYSYLGHVKATRDTPKGLTWPKWIARDFDLVVVSFDVLQREIHVARKDQSMARRKAPAYERARCPLVQTDFHRVVMDEVQLMKGSSHSAETVSMITRDSSIAVSGTLIRQTEDLQSSFAFLRVPLSNNGFKRLVIPMLAPTLISVLQILATRSTKAQVKEQLNIATQTKQVIPLDLNAIETAFYRDLENRFLYEAGCDESGNLEPGRQFNPTLLATHLLKLRQACTHPQVVNNALGGRLGAPNSVLRSIDDVLATMLETVVNELNSDRLLLAKKRITRAMIVLGDNAREGRQDSARVELENLLPELKDRISVLDGEIRSARFKGPGYEFPPDKEVKKMIESNGESEISMKEEEMEIKEDEDEEESGDEVNGGNSQTRSVHVGQLRNRRRDWMEQLHRVHQFLGNIYFQLGELEEGQTEGKVKWKSMEDDSYAEAEIIRSQMLIEPRNHIDKCLSEFKGGSEKLDLKIEELHPVQEFGSGGIASGFYLDGLNELAELLSRNGDLIFEWRASIIERLLRAVNRDVSQENEEDDQYQENLDAQVEAETFLESYKPLLAEREKIISGKTALGATAKPAVFFKLESQMAAVRRIRLQSGLSAEGDQDEGENVVKEQLAHFIELDKLRSKVKLEEGDLSVDGVILKLKEILERSDGKEAAIARDGIALARELSKEQFSALTRLRRDEHLLSNLHNARATYFKSMQQLSDHVRDVESSNVVKDLDKIGEEELSLIQGIGKKEVRVRYLNELGMVQSVSDSSEEARSCLICTDQINTGILTECGHITCEKCFKNWTSSSSICPVCRTKITVRDTHRIVYRKVEPPPEVSNSQGDNPASASSSSKELVFNQMDEDHIRDASSILIIGRFGTKLDFLLQYLLHIERTSNDKTLVFTSFSKGLDFVADSLKRNGIAFERLEGGAKRAGQAVETFKNSERVNVLLLHSEAQSSGLNLLCANRVFILEPLLNHGLELQAISRVSRIGATKPSQIFCLYARETVEERILHWSARNNRSLYLKDGNETESKIDSALLDIKSRGNRETNPNKKGEMRGGFVSNEKDLLSCLFDQSIFVPRTTNQNSRPGPSRPVVDEQARLRENRARAAEARIARAQRS